MMMPADAEDHETKYVLPSSAVPPVRAFLDGVCSPEQPFGASWIDSIYFDSIALTAFHDNLSSQLLKTKIRLRWYDRGGPAFAEIKRRRGEQRQKLRFRLDLRGEELAREGLSSALLVELPALLAGHGQPVPAELRPVVHVRFRRSRWLEPATGARVALDTEICGVALATRLGTNAPGQLPVSVVELKGSATRMPPTLGLLGSLGCRKSSFSKYAACVSASPTAWVTR